MSCRRTAAIPGKVGPARAARTYAPARSRNTFSPASAPDSPTRARVYSLRKRDEGAEALLLGKLALHHACTGLFPSRRLAAPRIRRSALGSVINASSPLSPRDV